MNINYNSHYNGRVNIMDNMNGTQNQFMLHDRIPAHQVTTYRDALQGNQIDTVLSQAFSFLPPRIASIGAPNRPPGS